MQGFSYHGSEKEVLISSYEIFLVKSFLQTQQAASAFCGELQQIPVPAGRRHCIQALMQGGHSLVSTSPGSPSQLHLHRATLLAKPAPRLLCLPMRTTRPSFYLLAVKPGTSPQLTKDEPAAGLKVLCSPHLSHVLLQGCCRTRAFGFPAFSLQEWVRFAWTK